MNIKIEDQSDTRKKILISILPEDAKPAEDKLLKEFASEAKLQGFRPGKAPVNLIRTRFKKEVAQELTQRLLTDAMKKASEDNDLEIFTVIDEEVPDIDSSKTTEVSVTVDVMPKIELPKYTGFDIKTESVEPTAEEIQKSKDYIINQRAEYDIVEKDIEKGDYVKLSYTGKIGDELVADLAPDTPIWGTQNMTWEEAGAEEAPGVQAIIQGIIGKKKDDKADFEHEFAKDFEVEALAGKKASYSVEIHEIREKKLPELNEAFFSELGVENMESFEKQLGEKIKADKQQRSRMEAREEIVKRICDSVEFPVPESALESKMNEFMQGAMQRRANSGMSAEMTDEERDKLIEDSRTMAARRVKAQFVLNEIAKKEKIELDDESLKMAILNTAYQTHTPPEELVNQLKQDRQRLEHIKMNALEDKILSFLEQKSTEPAAEEASKEEALAADVV